MAVTSAGLCALSMTLTLLAAAACGGGSAVGDAATDAGPGDPDAGMTDAESEPTPDAAVPWVRSTDFASTATQRDVPRSGLSDGFAKESSGTGVRWWWTTDIDRDGVLDIVQTGDTAVSQQVWDAAGAPYWKVFRGTSATGATEPIVWSVPPKAAGGYYVEISWSPETWGTWDVSGDGRPDLVSTADPATGHVWDATGSPYWKVHLGQAQGGFASEVLLWSVPPSVGAEGYWIWGYGFGNLFWRTLDLTGDGRVDLVVTADPATGAIWDASGSPYWKVYASTGTGFAAEPTSWSVPPSGTALGFRSDEYGTGGEKWVVVDLDGDHRADLVQTADPATSRVWGAGTDARYWKLFRNTGSGFAPAVVWPVPSSGLLDGFMVWRHSSDYQHWTLLDLDGDGDLDLVQTGDRAQPASVWDEDGSPYWKLFENTGAGFSQTVHRFAVPKSGTFGGFYTTSVDDGARQWFVGDSDGDGRLDLIQTADPSTSKVWDPTSPYWKVYRGQVTVP